MKSYTAIVPAAGKGVRLLPYTEHCPKTMLSVAGRPIVSHIIEQLLSCGIKRVVFIVGYQKEVLIDFVRSHYPQVDSVFVEQPEPKGLGQAIYLAKPSVTGPCLIVLGDTLIDGDLRPLTTGQSNCVGVKTVEDPRRFGVVEMKDGRIIGLEEKPEHPKSNLALIGAYGFVDSQGLFAALEEVVASGKTVKNEIQLTDALELLLQRGTDIEPVYVHDWFDCGNLDSMLHANRVWVKQSPCVPPAVAQANKIVSPCWIAPSAVIENCVLGPYVSVGEEAVLRGCTLQDSIISPQSRLENQNGAHLIVDKYHSN